MGTSSPGKRNWHDDVFFGIHYDLHARDEDTELGREVTHDHLRERWRKIKPDWVQCDCKGHPGYTSWPTETGTVSPGVVKDALRIHRDVTAELGIKLGMHYSGVIDVVALEQHPDWARIDAAGKPNDRSTCRLSPYADELMIPQLLELVEKYDVDGFWVDGENWGSQPCWCDRCRAEFAERTGITEAPTAGDQPRWGEWLSFQRDVFKEYVTKYADAVHAKKPTCLICSNWMYTVRQPESISVPVDYLSGDYTPNLGAYRAALEARLLDCREITWDLMVWGFTRNAVAANSPSAMKPVLHLSQEVAEVVALGGAVMIYAKPQRSGWLTGWEHRIIADLGGFCRARQDVCFQSKPLPEAAILHLDTRYYTRNDPLFNYGGAMQSIEGALHVLLETHRSTDLLTTEAALEHLPKYKLVVVPDQHPLTEEMSAALQAFARGGGVVLLSGTTLSTDHPDLVGADPSGVPVEKQVAFQVGNQAIHVGGAWQPVSPRAGTVALSCLLSGLEPVKDDSDRIAITQRQLGKGAIVAIHGPLFLDYYHTHFPRHRCFIAELINKLAIDWEVTIDASPRLELIARRKNGKSMLNLINRGAGETLSGQRMIITELPPVEDVTVRLRRTAPPKDVVLAPGNRPLQWSFADGCVRISVPRIEIHDIVVVT